MNRKSGAARSLSAQSFTDKQGQYLAFIYTYSHMFRRPPAEADMQRFFEVTPPSVHRMIVELESRGSFAECLGSRAASRSRSKPLTCLPSNRSKPLWGSTSRSKLAERASSATMLDVIQAGASSRCGAGEPLMQSEYTCIIVAYA